MYRFVLSRPTCYNPVGVSRYEPKFVPRSMMNSNNSRYVVNIWQAVPHANFTVLTVDLCRENDDGVDRQPSPAQPSPAQPSPAQHSTSKLHFQNNQLFKKVLRQFKMRSTAEWFTVIVICTVEEQAKILESMNKELNLPSELCFWIDGNHSSTKKDVNKAHHSRTGSSSCIRNGQNSPPPNWQSEGVPTSNILWNSISLDTQKFPIKI